MTRVTLALVRLFAACAACTVPCFASAAIVSTLQTPAGSVAFGASVAVLPNGNIVVVDTDGPVSNIGAVYLFDPNGTLVNSFTGSSPNDHVGSGGITVLKNGNFVISSPQWHNQAITDAGAVTWVNGTSGMPGVVSDVNSFVGSNTSDKVGGGSIKPLANGNYLIVTPTWQDPMMAQNAGAVTFGNGLGGAAGPISSANSLVGLNPSDQVGSGGVVELSNGNYVVISPLWDNAMTADAGAVTWGSGTTGVVGQVLPGNSLVGSQTSDSVGSGGAAALPNGNYVVASPQWANATLAAVGAVTYANGVSGLSGAVTTANSLSGTHANDQVGSGGITVLSNGHYVVISPQWANVSVPAAGAVTWANGVMGQFGTVSAANSLVGSSMNDRVGTGPLIGLLPGAQALTNGNYVVVSAHWSNGATAEVGAVTWVDGSGPSPSVVSPANSLIGSSPNDMIGLNGITALPSGKYVVASMYWSNGMASQAGAVTLLPGTQHTSASVSAANSLVGSTNTDWVGSSVVALNNGNFVVGSGRWNNAMASVGALTWINAAVGLTGPVTVANSLTGTLDGDGVGGFPVALSNGSFVTAAAFWNGQRGAATWGNGVSALTGTVSAANSLVGNIATDFVSYRGAVPLPGGYYILSNNDWSNGMLSKAGAISLGRGNGSLHGLVTTNNSVLGTQANGGVAMTYAFDATRSRMVVGDPKGNLVTLFSYVTADQIFANDFE